MHREWPLLNDVWYLAKSSSPSLAQIPAVARGRSGWLCARSFVSVFAAAHSNSRRGYSSLYGMRQAAQDRRHKFLELLICLPSRQHKLIQTLQTRQGRGARL
uniref:Uncharacterized protein n=1 Tax=Chelativorans sp. (strain BNC1) TaxID=266779 RepID=Q11F30_CHESB